MTTTAYDDQFAECTPEEEEFFREKQAHDEEQASIKEREQRAEHEAIGAMGSAYANGDFDAGSFYGRMRSIYAAIRDGKIPGVEIKRGDV